MDPYYLTTKAEMLGYNLEVFHAGRRINDSMGTYVAERIVKANLRGGSVSTKQTAVVVGLNFKEDVANLRNSKVMGVNR